MLSSLHVQNFKCLRDVRLDLGPLTVLIGPNDSGKSSILDALRLLGRTFVAPLVNIFHGDDDIRQLAWKQPGHPGGEQITLTIGFRQPNDWMYELELKRSNFIDRLVRRSVLGEIEIDDASQQRHETRIYKRLASDNRPASVLHEPMATFIDRHEGELRTLATAPRYHLNPAHLRSSAVPSPDVVLSPDGDNLVAVLDRLITGPDRTAIARLEHALNDAVPTLRGVALRTIDGTTGAKALDFVLAGAGKGPPLTIPCAHASDGAMLLTAFLALAFSDDPGLLIIEEPENGLHPSRLQSVVDMLRKISEGAIGNQPRQVIVTTHSPLLLNYTRPEEVRIVRRDLEKGTQVTPMTDVPDLQKLLGEFGPGELWYLLGEQALVEGKKP